MAHVNLDMDFDGTGTSIGTTLAKLLAVADEHPDGYSISAQFTGKPHTIDVQVQVRHVTEVDAILLRDTLKPRTAAEKALMMRLLTALEKQFITSIGQLRQLSIKEILKIDYVGPTMVRFLTGQLEQHQGIQLREE